MIEAAQLLAAALGWLSGVVGAMLAVRRFQSRKLGELQRHRRRYNIF